MTSGRELLGPLNGEHCKAQKNFEQDREISEDCNIQRLASFRSDAIVLDLHSFLGLVRLALTMLRQTSFRMSGLCDCFVWITDFARF